MGDAFTFFIVVLILLAVITHETFVVILLYLFIGASLLGQWWVSRTINRLNYQRKLDKKVFPGESIPVQINIKNGSLLQCMATGSRLLSD
jgi:hypothetical protein